MEQSYHEQLLLLLQRWKSDKNKSNKEQNNLLRNLDAPILNSLPRYKSIIIDPRLFTNVSKLNIKISQSSRVYGE